MNKFLNTQAERVKRVLNATFLQPSANREPAGETASAAEPQAEEPTTAPVKMQNANDSTSFWEPNTSLCLKWAWDPDLSSVVPHLRNTLVAVGF